MSIRKNRFIGDKAFYAMVLGIALPIMIQNGFTNFVNLLDNVMVGRIGTEEMSGVSIANTLIFVYNICIFGGTSGAGIYGAQYFGSKDDEGVRETLRYKLLMGAFLAAAAILIFTVLGESLIGLFLKGSADGGNLNVALSSGKVYLEIMSLSLPGFMLISSYASTLREGGETVLPMKAGIIAISANLVGNYLLIFGHFGLPKLGVVGAAIATVISRYIEAAIVIIGAHRKSKLTFTKGLYAKLSVPADKALKFTKAALPLLLNEAFWALGVTFLTQCYSTRGLNAVAGYNISHTLNNLFNVTFLSLGTTVGIIIGQLLGAGKIEEAVDTDRKLITFAIFIGALSGIFMAAISPLFPLVYNTTPEVRLIARNLIIAEACCLPLFAFKNSTYYTLRSGGKIWVTILFDSAYVWAIGVPIAFIVSRFTNASVVVIYLCVQAGDILKCVLGVSLVKKGIWIRNIVS